MSASNYNDPLVRGPGVVETTTTMVGGGAHTHRRISWAAIFGGVVLVVAVQLLLSMLGAGIGLGTVNTNAGSTPDASSFGIGAGVWWVVSSMIALGFGGYVAAWLAGIELRWDGLLHGLVTWGIATLLTIYLLSLGSRQHHRRRLLRPRRRHLGGRQRRQGCGAAAARRRRVARHGPAAGAELPQARQPGSGDDDAAGRAEGGGDEPGHLRQGRPGRAGGQAARDRHHGGAAAHQHGRRGASSSTPTRPS